MIVLDLDEVPLALGQALFHGKDLSIVLKFVVRELIRWGLPSRAPTADFSSEPNWAAKYSVSGVTFNFQVFSVRHWFWMGLCGYSTACRLSTPCKL